MKFSNGIANFVLLLQNTSLGPRYFVEFERTITLTSGTALFLFCLLSASLRLGHLSVTPILPIRQLNDGFHPCRSLHAAYYATLQMPSSARSGELEICFNVNHSLLLPLLRLPSLLALSEFDNLCNPLLLQPMSLLERVVVLKFGTEICQNLLDGDDFHRVPFNLSGCSCSNDMSLPVL